MICFAERIGVYESTEYDEHRFPDIIKGTVPIIRILKNPKIDIIDGYGYGTDFAVEFDIIYNNVWNLVKDAGEIEDKIESIHLKWNGLINSVKNEATEYKSVSIGLDIIHNFIIEGKHNEIEKYVSARKREGHSDKKVGVMEQFFIKLATAKVRAELNGLIKLYSDEKSDAEKSNRLSTKFLEEYMSDSFYNEFMTVKEFWNISFNNIDAERKLKIWKLVLFNENPITETALITKKDNLKYRNRCLKLAMILKMKTSKKNFMMRVNEWCIVLGALIEILNGEDKFETYDKSGFKSYRTFSAAVKALDNDAKRTKHSDAALRLYIKKRERQLFTCDELAQKTDSFIKDVYILENQIMSYNIPDVISNTNRDAFLNIEIYSVSEVAKQYEYLLAVIKLGELIKNKKNMTEIAVCPIMCANMYVNLVFWGFYYRSIFYEEKIKNHYNIKAKQYMAKINTEVYDREKLMEWNRDIIWKNISSLQGYSDEIIERFADELCREDITIGETMKYAHTIKDSDGFEFKVEIGFMVHKNPDLIWIQYCKFNEKKH